MTKQKVYEKFARSAPLLLCPFCQDSLHLDERSLLCPSGHRFDLSKWGSVNLIPHKVNKQAHYDKDNFIHRNHILEAGYYQAILQAVAAHLPEQGIILDVACGEGYYARNLAQAGRTVYAFDLSKDSIQLAAKLDKASPVSWLVADLADLPFEDHSVDVILDIYSPANYSEFKRVLKENGLLIKVVPTSQHLHEIRQALGATLEKDSYDNQSLIALFKDHMNLVEEQVVEVSYPLNPLDQEALFKMTPLLFNVPPVQLEGWHLDQITIAGHLLIGKIKKES